MQWSPSATPTACPASLPQQGGTCAASAALFCPMAGRMCMDQLLVDVDRPARCPGRAMWSPSSAGDGSAGASGPRSWPPGAAPSPMSFSPGWAGGWSCKRSLVLPRVVGGAQRRGDDRPRPEPRQDKMRRAWVLSPCPSVVLIPCEDPVCHMAEPYSRRIKASAIQALALSYLPTCCGTAASGHFPQPLQDGLVCGAESATAGSLPPGSTGCPDAPAFGAFPPRWRHETGSSGR